MFQTRLKLLRESRGYKSQQSFADTFGVAQSTVGGWESGKREPNFSTAIRLASFFGVTTDYLLGYDHDDEYSLKFRENLSFELGIVSTYFAGDEPETDDYCTLEEVSNCNRSLSLAEACEAADLLGSTVGHLLGEDEYDGSENESATKKSLDPAEAGPRDDMEQEFISLVRKLQPDQKPFLLALLRTAVEQTQGKPGADPALNTETAPKIEHQEYSK